METLGETIQVIITNYLELFSIDCSTCNKAQEKID